MPVFEPDPTEQIAVAAVGEPGRRQFFLLASGAGRTLTLSCEKSQIQALLVRLQQMIEAQGLEGVAPGAGESGLKPGEPEWQDGGKGLGDHEDRRMVVLVASQAAAREGGAGAGAASVRVWLCHKQGGGIPA